MSDTIRADFHVHSHHSHDAHHSIDEMCRGAFDKGFSLICFTEHSDYNPKDGGYGHFNFEKYSDEIERARDTWHDKLTILKGIEFGEPGQFPELLDEANRLDYDFIMGSVHNLEGHEPYWTRPEKYRDEYNARKFYEDFYRFILQTVEHGGFDSLAHMDFPVRFISRVYLPEDIIAEIAQALVRQNIAMELNAAPYRFGREDIHPGKSIREIYAKNGGIRVTAGSDSHTPDVIGAGFDRIEEMIQEQGFNPVGFVQRKEISLLT